MVTNLLAMGLLVMDLLVERPHCYFHRQEGSPREKVLGQMVPGWVSQSERDRARPAPCLDLHDVGQKRVASWYKSRICSQYNFKEITLIELETSKTRVGMKECGCRRPPEPTSRSVLAIAAVQKTSEPTTLGDWGKEKRG
jgi:hypothetical protein